MTKWTGYCGIDCSGCEGFLATQADDDAQRAAVAADWSARYDADIKPEQIHCDGCRTEGRKFFFTETLCEIRKCAIGNKVETCAACDRFPCETIEAFSKVAPEARANLDAMAAGGDQPD